MVYFGLAELSGSGPNAKSCLSDLRPIYRLRLFDGENSGRQPHVSPDWGFVRLAGNRLLLARGGRRFWFDFLLLSDATALVLDRNVAHQLPDDHRSSDLAYIAKASGGNPGPSPS